MDVGRPMTMTRSPPGFKNTGRMKAKAMDQIAGKTSITLGGKEYQLRGPTIREIEDKLGDLRRDLQAEAKRSASSRA